MTPWRTDPALRGRFHPDFPDDLQVLTHDGGPRVTDRQPELIWVRVVGVHDGAFRGVALNKPDQLRLVDVGQELLFVVPTGWTHPLQVRPEYLRERARWKITPCDGCGLGELFDPPSQLIRILFPDAPGRIEQFTSFCGACGGVQMIEAVG